MQKTPRQGQGRGFGQSAQRDKTTPRPHDDNDDDVTIHSGNSGKARAKKTTSPYESTVKLEFTSKKKMHESDINAAVFKILHAIRQVSKNMKIYTNQGNEMKDFSTQAAEANVEASAKAFKSFSLVRGKGTKFLT